MEDPLSLWNDGDSKSAIVDFVENAASDVSPEERIAVFDNDGTLWCEKPMPIQLDFILRRLFEMAEAIPSCVSDSPGKPPTNVTTRGWVLSWPSTMRAMTRTSRCSWQASWRHTRG